ncbi:hypothetical protein AVEN_115770-1, partial [Araneus ventricosus]
MATRRTIVVKRNIIERERKKGPGGARISPLPRNLLHRAAAGQRRDGQPARLRHQTGGLRVRPLRSKIRRQGACGGRHARIP